MENIMTTGKQIRATRTNANKSTRPLTGQGKARAAKNALQHELRARQSRVNTATTYPPMGSGL